MKKRRWRLASVILVIALTAPVLDGCKVGDTEVRITSARLRNHRTIFRINDYKCDIRMAKLYLCNYRNLYGRTYGIDLWDNYDPDLEQYVKDVTVQELTHIACMDMLAQKQSMKLTAEEKKQTQEAATTYYQSLTEAEKEFLNMHESDIREAYEDYALAEKLYREMTHGTNEEVSDDEARVIRVQQIFVSDAQKLASVRKALNGGEDFLAVANAYNEAKETECTVARGDYPEKVEQVAFDLANDECSAPIQTDKGYYIIKCLNKYEKELTEANKETIRISRKKERFESDYRTFVSESTFRLNEELWNSVTLKDVKGIQTDSFFALYDQYFQNEEEEE